MKATTTTSNEKHTLKSLCLRSLEQARSPLFKETASRIFAINTMYINTNYQKIMYFKAKFPFMGLFQR